MQTIFQAHICLLILESFLSIVFLFLLYSFTCSRDFRPIFIASFNIYRKMVEKSHAKLLHIVTINLKYSKCIIVSQFVFL